MLTFLSQVNWVASISKEILENRNSNKHILRGQFASIAKALQLEKHFNCESSPICESSSIARALQLEKHSICKSSPICESSSIAKDPHLQKLSNLRKLFNWKSTPIAEALQFAKALQLRTYSFEKLYLDQASARLECSYLKTWLECRTQLLILLGSF